MHIYMGMATICLQTVIYISGRGSRTKQSYTMTCGNTSTFNLARGVSKHFKMSLVYTFKNQLKQKGLIDSFTEQSNGDCT